MSKDTIGNSAKTRKVLSLKNAQPDPNSNKQKKKHKARQLLEERFQCTDKPRYMVWHEDGDAPKRIYDNPYFATKHAKELSENHGCTFQVFRTWRVIKPKGAGKLPDNAEGN